MKGSSRISFDNFYESLYGNDRWPELKDALLRDSIHFELNAGLRKSYYLDYASVIAASMLPITDGDAILDACAAPGGKTLVLAGRMGENCTLVSNERSAARRSRLKRVIEDHLSLEVQERITVTSHDATKWGMYQKDHYDAILMDIPCSSERHVLHKPEELKKWSPSRTKQLGKQGYAFLASAMQAVKIGGYVLYSTCALSQLENDAVISKAYKKGKYHFDVVNITPEIGEQTEHGWMVLPDRCDGKGPMFFTLLQRTQ